MATGTTTAAASSARSVLQTNDVKHLLRRLAFTATPDAEHALAGQSVDGALELLIAGVKQAPQPATPDVASGVWTNTALRYPETAAQDYQERRAIQSQSNQHDIEQLRQWWLREMIAGPSPLRENLTLFIHGMIGGSTGSADMPHAIYCTNGLMRRACLETVPSLLEQLVVDPATMIQIGVDEYTREKLAETPPNLRPATLILDNWTVGDNEYTDADAVNLARALTGWILVAPPGHEPTRAADPHTFRSAQRTGLTPVFDRLKADDGPKTAAGGDQYVVGRDRSEAVRLTELRRRGLARPGCLGQPTRSAGGALPIGSCARGRRAQFGAPRQSRTGGCRHTVAHRQSP